MIVSLARNTIRMRKLLSLGDAVVIGTSGGPDSAALLCALAGLRKELRLRLFAASVNHGLRPEATQDVEIARNQAVRMEVRFTALHVDVGRGAGVQARARELRYEALLDHARTVGAVAVAVGHTQDDQAETVLMRQLRGAGLRGLAGVQPARIDGVIRPLIDCARVQVHGFARRAFDELAMDASNRDSTFSRVRVRERLLPAFRSEDPAIVRHLAQLADEAREMMEYIDSQAAENLSGIRNEAGGLPLTELRVTDLRALPRALLVPVLRTWLRERTGHEPGRAHLEQLRNCVRGHGEVLLARGWRVRVVELSDGSRGLSLDSSGGSSTKLHDL